MGPSDDPVILWARPVGAHVSLGPHQDAAAELALDGEGRAAGLPVVRRETGGGTVYVDGGQWVFAFIVPRRRVRGRPTDLFGRLLPAVARAYRCLGLPVAPRGVNDLWCGDRKIGGTGMATIGQALVLTGSFLLRFPADRFAAAVRCPSPEFRRFLGDALAESVVAWEDLAPRPAEGRVKRALRGAVARELGWVVAPDRPSAREAEAIAAAEAELQDPDWLWEPLGRRAVAEGIKLKGDAFLTERSVPGLGRVTVLTGDGRIRRLALEGVAPEAAAACQGCPPEAEALAACLPRPWARAVADVAVCSESEGARRPVGNSNQQG
jgi:lipoate-protein ligase A